MALPTLTTPKYEAIVPSTQQKILFRPYLVKEEKILLIALESADQGQILRAMKDIIEACTFGSLNPDALALFDIEYLFLRLRSKAVGEIAKIGLRCGKCEEIAKIEVNLDEITVKMPEKAVDTRIALTDTISVVMKYPELSAVSAVAGDITKIEQLVNLVVSCIDKIVDGETVHKAADQKTDDLRVFVENMSQGQFVKLQQFVESMPRLQHPVAFTCAKCGTPNTITLTGLHSFFA